MIGVFCMTDELVSSLPSRLSLSGVCLGAKISPEDEEKTNARSSRPSLKGWTHSDYSPRPGASLQAHRAGQKAALGRRVAPLEVGLLAFSKVLAHGGGLPATGLSV